MVVATTNQGNVCTILFVQLNEEVMLDTSLTERIRQQIRRGATPRHVPELILQVPGIPRTRSGKVAELAVKDTIEGRPLKNLSALANPEVLPSFDQAIANCLQLQGRSIPD